MGAKKEVRKIRKKKKTGRTEEEIDLGTVKEREGAKRAGRKQNESDERGIFEKTTRTEEKEIRGKIGKRAKELRIS